MSAFMLLLDCLLLLAAVVLSVRAALGLQQLNQDLDEADRDVKRLAAQRAELQRIATINREINLKAGVAVHTTSKAFDQTTNIVQASHQMIAAIPFNVLDAIPVTRPASRVVRVIHDETASGIYAAIRGINGVIRSTIAGTTSAASHVAAEIAQAADGGDKPIQATAERLDQPTAQLPPVDVESTRPES